MIPQIKTIIVPSDIEDTDIDNYVNDVITKYVASLGRLAVRQGGFRVERIDTHRYLFISTVSTGYERETGQTYKRRADKAGQGGQGKGKEKGA